MNPRIHLVPLASPGPSLLYSRGSLQQYRAEVANRAQRQELKLECTRTFPAINPVPGA